MRTSVGEIMQRWWQNNQSPFNEQLTAERTPIIQINGSYDISELRDAIIEEGTAEVSSLDSEYKLQINNAGDKAAMTSASRGRYTPGCASEVGVGLRFQEEITGDTELYWGYFDLDEDNNIYDGVVFGQDIDGTFVALYNEGVEEYKEYQKNWNINRNVDLTEGNVFQIRFTYYGYGLIEWRVLSSETGSSKQTVKTLHTYRPQGIPALSNSNLRVGVMIYSTNDTNQYSAYLSGRQFSIIGKANFKQRSVPHLVEEVSVPTTDYVPLMTFRKKADSRPVPISVQEHSIKTDNDLYLLWVARVDLDDDDNWITPTGATASETALEVNDDATTADLTNALKLNQYQALGGNRNVRSLANDINLTDIPDEYNICLLAKASNQTATVTAIGKMTEER